MSEQSTIEIPDSPELKKLTESRPSRAPSESHSSLARALAKATADAKAVTKDKYNSFANYDYASAEVIVASAKEALSSNGLSIIPQECLLDTSGPALILRRKFMVLHESGESMICCCDLPVEVKSSKGKNADKAMLAAQTASLNYFLRDLLLLPRYDKDTDIDSDEREEEHFSEEFGERLFQIEEALKRLGKRQANAGAWGKKIEGRLARVESMLVGPGQPESKNDGDHDRALRHRDTMDVVETIRQKPDQYMLQAEDVGVRLAQKSGSKCVGKSPTTVYQWQSIVCHWYEKASDHEREGMTAIDEALADLATTLTKRRYRDQIEALDPLADTVKRLLNQRELEGVKSLVDLKPSDLKWIRGQLKGVSGVLMDVLAGQTDARAKLVLNARAGLMDHLESFVEAKSMKNRLRKLCQNAEPPIAEQVIPSLRGSTRFTAPSRLTSSFTPDQILALNKAIEFDMIKDTDPRQEEGDEDLE